MSRLWAEVVISIVASTISDGHTGSPGAVILARLVLGNRRKYGRDLSSQGGFRY